MSSTRFKAVGKPELLSQTVETAIEDAIRAGTFAQGDKLPSEMQLCGEFGVSRTVMREALRMLSARGLLRIEKGKGIFVQRLTADSVANPMELYLHMHSGPDNALHVVGARQLIEPPIAAAAAVHHTEADAAKLRANIEALTAATNDRERLSQLDMAFHLLIAEATHNPVLPLFIRPIQLLMPAIKAGVYEAVGDAHTAAVHWHSRILDAILARDADRAAAEMTGHLEIAREHVEATLRHNAEAA
ncbi:FadR/GntR family transcriptional regulator [Rubrivirga sp. IMCC45206]|uniref:FadR/GntR family transcriptional regulator n=1 Tax=Rubrivirga sp. IMCC45206 TaxID=3391614 RepID=UPI0039903544